MKEYSRYAITIGGALLVLDSLYHISKSDGDDVRNIIDITKTSVGVLMMMM